MMNFFKSNSKRQESSRDLNEKPTIDTGISFQEIKNNQPFFSVCIPTYNRGNSLSQAIESVISQDFEDFELIICDNSSTDNTKEVVEAYQNEKIRYVYYENLVNMYANHNRCINLSKGEWIVFVHSDDSFFDNTILKHLRETIDLVPLDCHLITSFEHTLPYWNKKTIDASHGIFSFDKHDNLIDFLISNMGIAPTGSFYRKSYMEDNLFDDFGVTSDVFTSDRTLAIKVLIQNKIICLLDKSLISKTHVNSSSYKASFNCNWHNGLARTMKVVVNDPNWLEIIQMLKSDISKYGRLSIDLIIRLATAGEWNHFWDVIKFIPKRHLLTFRMSHVLVIMLFGKDIYFFLLTFYRKNFAS